MRWFVIIDDNLFEGNEVFTMIIQNSSGVAILDPRNTTVTIINDEGIPSYNAIS